MRRALDDDLARWPGVRRDRAEALARRLQGASTRADGELTAREREVAALVADGLTNGQLAERLFISPKTAAVHVSNILAKLGLSTRAEIAAWAVRHSVADRRDLSLVQSRPGRDDRVPVAERAEEAATDVRFRAMGQMVAVTEKPSTSPGVVRFELNRALTGMGHEHFRVGGRRLRAAAGGRAGPAAVRHRPGRRRARLLQHRHRRPGQGRHSTGLADIVRHLYQYWQPGMAPPTFEDLQPEEEPAAAPRPGAGGDGGGDAALAEAAKRVPMHLLERSRAARERWKAKAG